jgi:putative transcriptional regulator
VGSEDDFERLLSGLTEILGQAQEEQEPASSLQLTYAIDVAAIRHKTGLSQAVFARRIGVPVATIRNWEQGRRSPQGPARILLALLDRNPRVVEETLRA